MNSSSGVPKNRINLFKQFFCNEKSSQLLEFNPVFKEQLTIYRLIALLQIVELKYDFASLKYSHFMYYEYSNCG